MLGLVAVRAVVAIGQAAHVETDDFAAVGEGVGAVAFDGWLGGVADLGPIEVGGVEVGRELGDYELPQQVAVALVEAHEDRPVALVFGVARALVVGPDVDAAARDDR